MRGGVVHSLLMALPAWAKRLRAQRISAIVATYNRSAYLRLAIASLEMQTRPPDEVVIADDGSDPEHVAVTRQIIAGSRLKIIHAWQEHQGYRVAASNNNAARQATGDWLFFTGCDAVLFPDVLEQHIVASRWRHWVSGFCLRLTPDETRRVTEAMIRERRLEELWPGWDDPRCAELRHNGARQRSRAFRAARRPSERRFRRLPLITIQALVPREAFVRVNGFDETFQGWGDEDIDLGLRLQIAGVQGRIVTETSRVLHLYHEPLPLSVANRRYYWRPRNGVFRCDNGLVKGAPPDAQEPTR